MPFKWLWTLNSEKDVYHYTRTLTVTTELRYDKMESTKFNININITYINIAYNTYSIKDICYHTVGKRNISLNKNFNIFKYFNILTFLNIF